MKRLLVFFSYIGTNYKGLQRLHGYDHPDLQSVQGILEYGLSKIVHTPVQLIVSSRTDIKVHAVESSAHFDLREDLYPGPERICQFVNSVLEGCETDVRVRRVVEVTQKFHARRATSRSYCYRVAVAKNNDFLSNSTSLLRRCGALPISEVYRCQVVPQPFEVEKVQDACKVFLGRQNFRTFMLSSRETKFLKSDDVNFQKTVFNISFSKQNGCPEADHVTNNFDPVYNKFDFYELNLEASGFLRRQVRRMMGALIGVGHGTVTEEDIVFMLQNPSEANWMTRVHSCSADGLFLKSVNYKDLDKFIVRGPYS